VRRQQRQPAAVAVDQERRERAPAACLLDARRRRPAERGAQLVVVAIAELERIELELLVVGPVVAGRRLHHARPPGGNRKSKWLPVVKRLRPQAVDITLNPRSTQATRRGSG
jgi:hypothetical protein